MKNVGWMTKRQSRATLHNVNVLLIRNSNCC
jgi:hypothetical protein